MNQLGSKSKFYLAAGVLLIIGGMIAYLNLQPSRRVNAPAASTLQEQMAGTPTPDSQALPVNDNTAANMVSQQYQYSGALVDVTTGAIRGLDTKSQAAGTAMSKFEDGNFSLLATFSNLPDPQNDEFYEGWIVRKQPFNFISTGKVEKLNGVYTNAYQSNSNLTDHATYVLTLEPDDGNPAPADHIVEGDLVR